jgi:hypothetical protein
MEKKRLMGKMMKVVVLTLMGNHTYRFNGKVYKQEDGGSIGLEATQAIARLVMMKWDKLAKALYEKLEMKMMMYQRYVDDVDCGIVPKPEGTCYIDGELIVTEERKKEDEEMTRDARTGRLMREIANTIMPMIKMVEDVPSNHATKRIPILDLEVWIEREDGGEGRPNKPRVKHRFFKKPMASEVTLNARSAYPIAGTRATITEETLRRLRNCSPEDKWEDKGRFLSKWAVALKRGGHSEKFRIELIEKAVRRYDKELTEHKARRKDLYRSREERERQMMEKGGKNRKDTWFRKKVGRSQKEVTSIFRLPITKGGKLKENVEKKMEDFPGPEGVRAQVVENGGRTTKSFLVRGDPFPRTECTREECPIKEGKCREKCYSMNVNYMMKCKRCDEVCDMKIDEKIEREDVRVGEGNGNDNDEENDNDMMERNWYAGESSRSIYFRYQLHLMLYRGMKNHMWEHVRVKHEGRLGEGRGKNDFEMVVTGTDREVIRRIVRESVKIRRLLAGEYDEEENEADRRRERRRCRRTEENDTENDEERKTRRRKEEEKKVKIVLLNDKNEWFTPKIVSVSMTQL